jgi:CheY-like chemotaxis protein
VDQTISQDNGVPTMSSKSWESIAVEDSSTCDRLQPFDDVAAVGRAGDTSKCIPAGRRLLRVLVADDDRDTAWSLSRLVKMWGHDVRVAYGGAEALAMASAYQPDVLLLDIAMPALDGCRLAQQLRRQTRFKDTLLVAITGYADEAHRLLGEEASFDHYLVKPAEPSAVEELLLLAQGRLPDSPKAPLRAPSKPGILVVDDEECVRGTLNLALRPQGFAVWLAANGPEALELYRHHRETIDAVLLDVRMPGLDGPQTLAGLKELNPQVRCCFMSGDLGSYTEERLRNLGAAAVLLKPFRLPEVTQVLWELASHPELAWEA